MRDPVGESPLEQAVKRLDRAISQLEQRLAGAGGQAGGGLFDQDGARLASELEKAKVRERELEAAGAEASAALGRAISEIKAALAGEPAQETEEA
ncbi:hypothetical protein ASE17_11005 [Phenylobacterium sp. Root77]|jgi:hypothetical protein|uniref:DUF4164 family protein n=1 Tax=unclassified Phenylobacterium TaxID=2640670 RepID=UPI0006F98B41|nr:MULTISPECIES: DUF4164 family protein [unclassified Phenylobacterium]KQW73438.1 hypothetical protein ASC73_03575 [Phenylobacterium sp. Root1277]KQW92657.1 hypothetical protein ASC79_14285 [Phenylobacterium sp. Root1290]KRC40884.1 hypothetical protein ASE17_11005 [Phenylobacterium sp. Root77]